MNAFQVLGISPQPRTPANAWSTRCGGWDLPAGQKIASAPSGDEEMNMMLKGLEKIWATPSPVTGAL